MYKKDSMKYQFNFSRLLLGEVKFVPFRDYTSEPTELHFFIASATER